VIRAENGEAFLKTFFRSRVGPQVLVMTLFTAVTFSAMAGLIPDVTGDRYARLYHGYDGPDCSTFGMEERPAQCHAGSDDAQSTASGAAFVQNIFGFLFSSVFGTISDSRGRKPFLVGSMVLFSFFPLSLLMVKWVDTLHPLWFYVSSSSLGIIGWIPLANSMISDIMPPKWRAPGVGLFWAAAGVGFSVGPSLCLVADHFCVLVVCFALGVAALLWTTFFMEESLPQEVAAENMAIRRERAASENQGKDCYLHCLEFISRPVRDLWILNRDPFCRRLAICSFFFAAVFSANINLIVFYVDNHMGFTDADTASMFWIFGSVGIFAQAVLMKPLLRCFKEKNLTILVFACGIIHNLIYGLAQTKPTMFVGVALSELTKLAQPLMSSMASNHVHELELGQIQGALFSWMALANAIGPVSLEIVYNRTNSSGFPGAMFVFGGFLHAIGTVVACFLPTKQIDDIDTDSNSGTDLEEPLL